MTDLIKTIHGRAIFSYISEEDSQYGGYKVVLDVTAKEAAEHIKEINKIITNEKVEEGKRNPAATAKFAEAPKPFKETADGSFEFKIGSKFKPKMYDKKGAVLSEDIKIWKDTTMWITYKAQGYNKSIGLGCKLYFTYGQIDKLVSGVDGSNSPVPNREAAEEQKGETHA